MSSNVNSELACFQQFIGECIVGGDADLSPEEVLDLWRAKNPPPNEPADTISAVREAIEAYRAGDRGIPLEQFDREFRQHHNL